MKLHKGKLGVLIVAAGAVVLAQTQPPQPPAQPQPAAATPARSVRYGEIGGIGAGGFPGVPPPPRAERPPFERSMPGGRWWNSPAWVQRLNINSDQQRKMDDIFQQNRLRLIDLNATLQKEEVIMEPLVAADSPDETRILAQIDKVAQARAELEKANARFLLEIRRVLTADQWKKLQSEISGGGRATAPPPAGHGGR